MKPIEEKLRAVMNGIARTLDEVLSSAAGERMAFALIVADAKADGRTNFISNASRADMIKLLRETADKLEGEQ